MNVQLSFEHSSMDISVMAFSKDYYKVNNNDRLLNHNIVSVDKKRVACQATATLHNIPRPRLLFVVSVRCLCGLPVGKIKNNSDLPWQTIYARHSTCARGIRISCKNFGLHLSIVF